MILPLFAACALASQPQPPLSWHFDSPAEIAGYPTDTTGDAKKRMGSPKVENGQLTLLESWSNSSAAIALPIESEELSQHLDLSFTFTMNTGTEGMGFAWIDVDAPNSDGRIPPPMKPEDSKDPGGNPMLEKPIWGWEAPNLRHAFSLGLDALDPPNRDPFKGSGNVMDRPQHEISLHWDGLEIIKKTTTTEFRDEKPHHLSLQLDFVTGGATISLKLDDEQVFDTYFIPGMTTYAGRAVFGARNAETAGDVLLDDIEITPSGDANIPIPPTTILALDHVLNDKDHHTNSAEVNLPDNLDPFGRIIATLRLDKPESRFDPWDRTAHIFIENLDGSDRTELIRYITPYHRGFEWAIDVSDLRPLLAGLKRITQSCTTYGEGWVVSLTLAYYPGPAPENLVAAKVINLWCGSPEIGNPDHPATDFYTPKDFTLEPWVKAAKVRSVVSGHGMSPNTSNAAEFMSIGRTLKANDATFSNTLWKTDNYLNPCRPQGGTWKYDRAGWAPGDIVRPWIVDVTPQLSANHTLHLEYTLDPYTNEARGQTSPPIHITQSQLILYRDAK